MDPTITLSEGFSHLSAGDSNTQKETISRDTHPTLTRVSRKRDSFTDGRKTGLQRSDCNFSESFFLAVRIQGIIFNQLKLENDKRTDLHK